MPGAYVQLRAAALSDGNASSEYIGEIQMNNSKKMLVLMALLSVMYAIPTMAQISTKVTFDAPSDFYAGNAKMPAGSYTATQPNVDDNLLLIEDAGGSHSAFVEFVVAPSETPQAQTDVTFNKYGNVEFLGAIRIEGQTSDGHLLSSNAEHNAGKAASAAKHSLSAKNIVATIYMKQAWIRQRSHARRLQEASRKTYAKND